MALKFDLVFSDTNKKMFPSGCRVRDIFTTLSRLKQIKYLRILVHFKDQKAYTSVGSRTIGRQSEPDPTSRTMAVNSLPPSRNISTIILSSIPCIRVIHETNLRRTQYSWGHKRLR